MAEPKSRRENIKARPRTCRKLDPTPIEIPAGRKTIPDTKEMVKQYVHQALAQSGALDYTSVDEMLEEELDLDPEDPDPEWTSRYEVSEMDEVEAPRVAAPQPEGEPNEVQETEEKEGAAEAAPTS